MTDGAHDAGGGFGRSAGANAARGIMVIVAAVIVGVLLMQRGLSDGDVAADNTSDSAESDAETPAGDDETSDSGDTPEDSATTSTTGADTTLPAPRDPSEVKVLVLNGTDGLAGVAGRGTEVVLAANYRTGEPENADVVGPSVVLFQPGYEAEAKAVAELFGADPDAVVQPFDAATSPVPDTQEAHVIVRIGNDGVIQV